LHLEDLLKHAIARGASDIHLCEGRPPRIRVVGRLCPLDPPTPAMYGILCAFTPYMSPSLQARWAEGLEIDFSLAVAEIGRFRANVFLTREGPAAVLRHIRDSIATLTEIKAPQVMPDLLRQVGLLLVTGPTGSGKSTTLAALVQHLNQNTQQHIITLEDPIECLHTSWQCQVTQREVGLHSQSFAHALRAALRQDPDVILVGELRDLETIRLALTAAETGHLVLASLHTRSAATSIERIVDVFDSAEKSLVRAQLSDALIGVVSQRLYPLPQQNRQQAVFEVMVATPAIRHLIRDGKTSQILNAIQTGAAHGMQTMSQALTTMQKTWPTV